MERTAKELGRLNFLREQLQADSAEEVPFSGVTTFHEGLMPLELTLIVVSGVKRYSPDDPRDVWIFWPEDVYSSDQAVTDTVNIYLTEHKLLKSGEPPPAYKTPKPPAALATVVIGYEYPKGSGFYVGQGGQESYALGDRITYPSPGVALKPGWAPAGEYIRHDEPLTPTTWSVVRRGWRKVD